MNRLFSRPATLSVWASVSSVWGSVLCLSLACSSEEAPSNVAGEDSSASASSSAGSSSVGGSSSGTGGLTTTGPSTSQASSSGTTAGSSTTSPASTSPATSSATSGAATTETAPNEGSSSSEQSSQGQNTGSDNSSVDTETSDLGESTDEASQTVDDTSTSATSDTTNDATSTGATTSAGECSLDPSGDFVTEGEVVFDEKTCLSWMKSDVNGHPYAQADTYCADLTLGGYDDWRLPTAGEATTIFHCEGTFPPVYDVFTATYDGIWTTTETGTIAGDEPKVCGAGQASGQFYDFGKVGAQNTRCVRGPVTVPDREDCKTNNQICQ